MGWATISSSTFRCTTNGTEKRYEWERISSQRERCLTSFWWRHIIHRSNTPPVVWRYSFSFILIYVWLMDKRHGDPSILSPAWQLFGRPKTMSNDDSAYHFQWIFPFSLSTSSNNFLCHFRLLKLPLSIFNFPLTSSLSSYNFQVPLFFLIYL